MSTQSLQEMVQELPPDMRIKVRNFVEFLLAKQRPRARRTLQQNWAGALHDYQEQHTSLELQKQALIWRNE